MKHIRQDYNDRVQDSAGIIPHDEPVMLFRAQDKHMAQVLRHYAWLLRQDKNEEMAVLVSNHVLEVEKWQSNVKRKRPDCPVVTLRHSKGDDDPNQLNLEL